MSSPAQWERRGALDMNPRPLEDGLAHGITTRAIGREESAKALSAARIGEFPLFVCKQVHGTKIVQAPFEGIPEADGLITDRLGVALGVYVADCMPIFLWKPGGPFGVFHSGWKGTALGMPRAAVASLLDAYGVRAGELKAAIGAHIGRCCFEAREDCASKFPAQTAIHRDGKMYVDLFADALRQLKEAGVTDEPARPACTTCHPEDYFSFRRDKAGSRMLAFAGREG